MTRASTRPNSAPCSPSTAIVTCPTRLLPSPSSREPVVSRIARTSRPATRDAVPAAARSTIFPTVTLSLRRNRPIRTSPARLPPGRRTERPRGPCRTRRSCKNPYDRSTRRSPKNAAAPTIPQPLLPILKPRQTQGIGTTPKAQTPHQYRSSARCVHAVAPQAGEGKVRGGRPPASGGGGNSRRRLPRHLSGRSGGSVEAPPARLSPLPLAGGVGGGSFGAAAPSLRCVMDCHVLSCSGGGLGVSGPGAASHARLSRRRCSMASGAQGSWISV